MSKFVKMKLEDFKSDTSVLESLAEVTAKAIDKFVEDHIEETGKESMTADEFLELYEQYKAKQVK